ncbi:MAG: type II secretion system secretin GspD, partial [Deltaproteobacteria bacterium]|nr:type II secretion system secretin GspD [Deltaproteobacteria bacterium]
MTDMLKKTLFAILLCLALASIPASDGSCAQKPPQQDKSMLINFVDVDITAVTELMSRLTGKNFIFGSDVSGKITITSTSKVTSDEAFDLFISVLKLRGYSVVPAGKSFKIIPSSEIKQAPLEVLDAAKGFHPNEAYVSVLVKLEHMFSRDVLPAVQPLVSKDGYISGFGRDSRAILLVDSSLNVEKVLKIVRLIDVAQAGGSPEVVFLKHSQAAAVAQSLRLIAPARGDEQQGAQGSIIPDARLNAIVLYGSKEENARQRQIIEALDVPAPEASSKVNVYYLENAEAAEVARVLSSLKGAGPVAAGAAAQAAEAILRVSITSDKATNSLIIVASPEDYQEIVQVISKLDRRPRQVFVEAMITEVSLDRTLELGTKWRAMAEKDSKPILIGGAGTVDSSVIQNIVSGMSGLTVGGLANFITVPVTRPDGTVSNLSVPGFAALFSLSEFKDAIDVLSTPHILTSDNREAEIVVGENVPFLSRIEREAGTLNQPVLQSIERRDVGITLRIKPQISEGDFIKLDIYQEISAIAPMAENAADLITTKRSAKTSVVVKDKQTVVIGGLIQDRQTKTVTKVPLLGDIPLIGWLFRFQSTKKEKANLLVYLTPT